MTNSVTFPIGLGGSGVTIDDSSSPTTGLASGGHRDRFVPALSQTVIMAQTAVTNATNALTYSGNASTSATLASNWASQLGTPVSGGEYSAKYWAQAGAASATLASNWAVQLGTPVAGGEYSAKYWAQAAAVSAAGSASAVAFVDTNPIAKGSSDATKLVRLECDTNVPTATTVVLTVPAVSGTLALTSNLVPDKIVRSARASNTILGVADNGLFIDATTTFTQTFTAAATLASGWYCYYRNGGSGRITLDPNGAEAIEGVASIILDPGHTRLIQCDGTNFYAPLISTGNPDSAVIVHTGNGHGSTNTFIRRFTTMLQSSGFAITYADSATLGGSFTINHPGVYSLSVQDISGAAVGYFGVSVNSGTLTTAVENISVATRPLLMVGPASGAGFISGSATIRLFAGDVVRVHTGGSVTNSDSKTMFTIRQLSPIL